jgi:hypothetical protein
VGGPWYSVVGAHVGGRHALMDALDLSALLGEPLPLTLHPDPVTAGA